MYWWKKNEICVSKWDENNINVLVFEYEIVRLKKLYKYKLEVIIF